MTWQSDINAEQLVMQTIDDTDTAFQYQEPAWSTNPTNVNLFSDGTAQSVPSPLSRVTFLESPFSSTSTYNASVTLTFTVSTENQTLSIVILMDDCSQGMSFNI